MVLGELGPVQSGPRHLGPEAQLSNFWGRTVGPRITGLQGPTVQGPTVRGPTVRGPTIRGPICQEPIGLPQVVGKMGPGQFVRGPIYLEPVGTGQPMKTEAFSQWPTLLFYQVLAPLVSDDIQRTSRN